MTKRKIHVLDMKGATPEELMELKDIFNDILDMTYRTACDEVNKGNLYGCLHSHLEVALLKSKLDLPCDLCDIIALPKGEIIH